MIVSHHANNDIITSAVTGYNAENPTGLVNGHAYNLLDHITLSNGQRLIRLQNPWGSEKWSGDWGDSSTLWDEVAGSKEEAGFIDNRDGMFFMSYDDYWTQASHSVFTININGWYRDHFLMLDDQTVDEFGKNTHTLTLTSDVAQKIVITANTWEHR